MMGGGRQCAVRGGLGGGAGRGGWWGPPPQHQQRQPRPLLVLDLNGVLLYRRHREDSAAELRPPDARLGAFNVWHRPHSVQFFGWCLDHFDVVVWSSATERNVGLLLGCLPREYVARCLRVWHQRHCTTVPHPSPPPNKPDKPLHKKELRFLWADLAGLHGPDSTLLVDDDELKAQDNPPHCGVHPEQWLPGGDGELDLTPSGLLRSYLHAAWAAHKDRGSLAGWVAANRISAFDPASAPPPPSGPPQQRAAGRGSDWGRSAEEPPPLHPSPPRRDSHRGDRARDRERDRDHDGRR
eukprot:TRINITY_DN35161_c0_g1_i2.p1 TRINITY_DN35161_c0_g1~~TRINITY_DN35161_c0_g1_i2.p1  ORF type:complete len:323 (+),score=58.77 TRINITY_DN35161_c0_g1_i2:82-969(+)